MEKSKQQSAGGKHEGLREQYDDVVARGLYEEGMSKHDTSDSKTKFGYYFSSAEPDNGGILRFHPGGFEKERELTFELRRWKREFIDRIARDSGFQPDWHDPFISDEGLAEFGAAYFENYLDNPQSKLLELRK